MTDYRYFRDYDDVLCRRAVLDGALALMGAWQILRSDGWAFYTVHPFAAEEISQVQARDVAGAVDIRAAAVGSAGDDEPGLGPEHDDARFGRVENGVYERVRAIEARAKREGRDLTLDEAREVAAITDASGQPG